VCLPGPQTRFQRKREQVKDLACAEMNLNLRQAMGQHSSDTKADYCIQLAHSRGVSHPPITEASEMIVVFQLGRETRLPWPTIPQQAVGHPRLTCKAQKERGVKGGEVSLPARAQFVGFQDPSRPD
jgi:hypothetical protein